MKTAPAESMSSRVFRNTAAFVGGEFFYRLMGFASSVLVVRSLGGESYGQFSFIYVFVSFFEVFVQFGFNATLTRRASQDGEFSARLLGNAFLFRALLCFLALPLAYGLIRALHYPSSIQWGVALASFQLFFTLRAVLETVYRVQLKMIYPAFLSGLRAVLTFLFVLILHGRGATLFHFVAAYLATGFLHLAALAWMTRRFIRLDFRPDFPLLGQLLRESAPLLISGYLTILYYRIDVFMISKMKTFLDVGYYSVATRLTESLGLVATSLMVSLFPLMARRYQEDRAAFGRLLNKGFKVLFLLGLPMALGGMLVASDWVTLLFGPAYAPSGVTTTILLWYTCFFFVGALLANLLIACGKQMTDMWVSLGLLGANAVLNYFLIPTLSYNGAALSTVMVEILGVTIIFIYACRHPQIRLRFPADELKTALMAGILFFLVLFGIQAVFHFSGIVLSFIALPLYAAILFGRRIVSWADIKPLLFRKKGAAHAS